MAMMDDELLSKVVSYAVFAADKVAIGGGFATPADATQAAVTEAFKLALGNGLIRLVPQDEWPEYVALDPPYDPEAPSWR